MKFIYGFQIKVAFPRWNLLCPKVTYGDLHLRNRTSFHIFQNFYGILWNFYGISTFFDHFFKNLCILYIPKDNSNEF